MDAWKIAKFLLLNGPEDYVEYSNTIHEMRTFKNYWRNDYSKMSWEDVVGIYRKLSSCKSRLIAVRMKLKSPEFNVNTIVLEAEFRRVSEACNHGKHSGKVANTKLRQQLAKKNRSCGKSKNR